MARLKLWCNICQFSLCRSENLKIPEEKKFDIVGHEVFAFFTNKGGRGQCQPQNAIQPESYNRSMAPQFAVHDHGLLRPRLPWQVRPLPWLWQVTARLAPRPSAAPIKVIYKGLLTTKPLEDSDFQFFLQTLY